MRKRGAVAGIATLGLAAGLAAYGCQPAKAPDAGEETARPLPVKEVSYPEGAAYFGGKLYYVGFGDDTVHCWDGERSRLFRQLDKNSGPTAVIPVGDGGEMLVACYDNNTLVRLNKKGETLETIEVGKKYEGAGPNDFVKDSKGGVYFSTSGKFKEGAPVEGKVFYLDSEGKVQCVAKDIHYANGLALTDDDARLLVAETLKGQILSFKVGEGGNLSERRVWKEVNKIPPDPAEMHWYVGPDGLKTDSKGNVYICQFGAGRVLVTDKDGKWLRTLSVPYKYVTNVALDSNHEDVVYITAAENAFADLTKNEKYGGAVYRVPNR